MNIRDEYNIFYRGEQIGKCYVYTNSRASYTAWSGADRFRSELAPLGLDKDVHNTSQKKLAAIFGIKQEANRVPGTRKLAWQRGELRLELVPANAETFLIYLRSAHKNEAGYSEKEHSAPQREGDKTLPGTKAWVAWYGFNKKADGTYEAELDEVWYGGGDQYSGGTVRREVPEEWFDLPYEEFLERVVALADAAYYGFTAAELKEKAGLRAFFGY